MSTPNSIPELVKHARELMHKAVENTRREFSGIRSGKATTSLLDIIRVEAYGSEGPAQSGRHGGGARGAAPHRAAVRQVPRSGHREGYPRIRSGPEPCQSGRSHPDPDSSLNEERRKDLVKVIHKLAEEGRVAVRHARGEAHSKVKKLEKIAEDERTRGEKEIQKLTDDHIRQIDQLISAKEAEIMEV
jgi:ribosome recycling factor